MYKEFIRAKVSRDSKCCPGVSSVIKYKALCFEIQNKLKVEIGDVFNTCEPQKVYHRRPHLCSSLQAIGSAKKW